MNEGGEGNANCMRNIVSFLDAAPDGAPDGSLASVFYKDATPTELGPGWPKAVETALSSPARGGIFVAHKHQK